jgi:hypothetical protein
MQAAFESGLSHPITECGNCLPRSINDSAPVRFLGLVAHTPAHRPTLLHLTAQ